MTLEKKLEKLVLGLEEDAESANYSDLWPIYRFVAESVVKHASSDVAILVLKDFKKKNGFVNG